MVMMMIRGRNENAALFKTVLAVRRKRLSSCTASIPSRTRAGWIRSVLGPPLDGAGGVGNGTPEKPALPHHHRNLLLVSPLLAS